jgi:hypothetical protein
MCTPRNALVWSATCVTTLNVCAWVLAPPHAHADALAYLVNVTVRPGYNFANAQQALSYGNTLCDNVTTGCDYAGLIGEVKGDFGTDDEYQASYLINRAVNELCPQLIWQLCNSAEHYRPSPS